MLIASDRSRQGSFLARSTELEIAVRRGRMYNTSPLRVLISALYPIANNFALGIIEFLCVQRPFSEVTQLFLIR